MAYRVGRKVGRTIYRMIGNEPSDADELIGMLDTHELAALAVRGMNTDPVVPEAEPAPEPSREERLERALLNVLHQFHERGHPGYQAIRTGWVPVVKLDEWRRALER